MFAHISYQQYWYSWTHQQQNLRYMKKFLPTLHVIELALGGLVTNGKEHN